MRKTLHAIICAAALLTAAAPAAGFNAGGLTYSETTDSTATVTKYLEGTEIDIPALVTDTVTGKEYTVVAIAQNAFKNAAISSVKIAPTVKTIDCMAFQNSTVVSVKLSEGLESIGFAAFSKCRQLTSVNLPSTLKELGHIYAYFGMEGSAFSECGSLEKIAVPGSIGKVHDSTFRSCFKLADVELGEGITELGESVFEECSALKEIDLPQTLTTMGHGVFNKSGLVSPVVPGSVKVIPNSAYLWCRDMKSFEIEEGVVEVGKQSFAACYGFTEVNVPNSVEWIRTDAFHANDNVKVIRIGSGVRRMGHASLAVWGPDRTTNQPHWALTDIYIESPVPPVHEQNDDHFDIVDDDFFFGEKSFSAENRARFFSSVILHVPEEAIDTYKKADIWKNFATIVSLTDSGVGSIENDTPLTLVDGAVASRLPMKIYDAKGVLLADVAAGTFRLDTLGRGMYIVRSGTHTIKTVVP